MSPSTEGARFWAIDLHVHTPASGDAAHADFGEPEAIVSAALDAGLDAIAITDHNTYDWCDRVAQAAIGKDLIVLPGVELSTAQGHLLGIWEEGTSTSVISDFLVSVGINTADHGDLAVDTEKTFLQCCEEIAKRGGVAIAAHVEKEKGILKQVGVAATLRKILSSDSLSAVEIVHLDTLSELRRRSDVVPCGVRSSDTFSGELSRHALSAIGQRRTWIKASRPDLVGLRHALDDPDLRVRLDEPVRPAFPYIESVSVNGGFLGGQSFKFSPDMNCLLGETGSGKSLLLEVTRYALDQQVSRESFAAIREEVDARLADAFGPAGRALVTLRDATGKQYRVERVFSSDGSASAIVSERIGDDFVAVEKLPSDIMTLAAFSQGEVLEYSRQRVGRMSLIDEAIDLASIEASIEDGLRLLDENSTSILKARRGLDSALERSAGTKELGEQVERLSKFFDDELIESQSSWTAESAEISARSRALADFPLPTFSSIAPAVSSVPSNVDLLDEINSATSSFNDAVSAAQASIASAKVAAQTAIDASIKAWEDRHQVLNAQVDAKLEEVEPKASLPVLRQRLGVLQAELAAAKSIQDDIDTKLRPEIAALMTKRQEVMDDLFRLRRERRELRRARVRQLNARMTGAVKLDVPNAGDDAAYRTELNELKVGSRVRDDFVDAVARQVSPARFVRTLLDEDYASLASVDSAIDSISMAKFHANIISKGWESRLLACQGIECPDILTIKLKKPEDGNYEVIEKLSHGQRCTAILVILLADGTSPVLVDQPEDAVHAPWIEDYLVVRLRDLRGSRQYLFATRSPGLVVSGDCEQIITLKATAGQGVIEASGSLERHDLNRLALGHLEGGKVPFSRRARKFRPSIDVRATT